MGNGSQRIGQPMCDLSADGLGCDVAFGVNRVIARSRRSSPDFRNAPKADLAATGRHVADGPMLSKKA
jgi:hypothetical protein